MSFCHGRSGCYPPYWLLWAGAYIYCLAGLIPRGGSQGFRPHLHVLRPGGIWLFTLSHTYQQIVRYPTKPARSHPFGGCRYGNWRECKIWWGPRLAKQIWALPGMSWEFFFGGWMRCGLWNPKQQNFPADPHGAGVFSRQWRDDAAFAAPCCEKPARPSGSFGQQRPHTVWDSWLTVGLVIIP